MKYLIIGIMWLGSLWFHVILGVFVLPSPSLFNDAWYAVPLMITHMFAFIGYTAYFCYWAYKESEK